MKKLLTLLPIMAFGLLFTSFTTKAQTDMKTYVIERNIPGAGQFTAEKLKDISKTSCSVLKDMGPGIQWIQSYVTGDKIFCIYKAQSVELLREHAKKGGFPIDNVYEVATVISPATAGASTR